MSDYKAIKECLEKNGETMIKLATGEKLELHTHNVTFDDSKKEIVVDGGSEKYWIDANQVVYYWIHKEKIEKE
jgi:hypothetical protein